MIALNYTRNYKMRFWQKNNFYFPWKNFAAPGGPRRADPHRHKPRGSSFEPAPVIVRVRWLKNFKLNRTVTETDDARYVNTCGATCDEAIREGYVEMHRLIMDAYGMDLTEANTYMSVQGMLAANQACLIDEAGGNSFRTGTPKVLNMPPLMGKRDK